jgi:acetyl esterase/lipase
MTTGYARYIGRIGGLAVALGVGAAVAGGHGFAWADTTGSAASDASSTSSPAGGDTAAAGGDPVTAVDDSVPAGSPSAAAPQKPKKTPPKVVIRNSGGAQHTSRPDRHAADQTPPADGQVTTDASASQPNTSAQQLADAAPDTAPSAHDKLVEKDEGSASRAENAGPRRQPSSQSLSKPGASEDSTPASIYRAPATAPAPEVDAPLATDIRNAVTDAVKAPPRAVENLEAAGHSVASVVVSHELTSLPAIDTTSPQPDPTSPAPPLTASRTAVDVTSSVLATVLAPFANTAPTPPVEPPTMWTLLAFARREFEQSVFNESPTVNPLAGHIENALVTETRTLDEQSIDPAITGNIGAPTPAQSGLTVNAQLDATAAPATFTGQPSIANQITVAVFRGLRAFTDFTALFGVDTATPIAQLLTSIDPPWFTTLGLNVQRSEFDGMPVWSLQSANPSGKDVVAVHGGAFIFQPNIFNWLDYAAIAGNTGATVIVPIYPLAPQGTAGTVVPAMADLISSQIDQHGAQNVSVFGDSAGGDIALAAVQELVRRGDPVPSHMVLSSPGLDLTFSNPAMQFIDDPILSPQILRQAQQWAGDLDLNDPLVSPLYGSLAGLPPTAVYFGSLDVLSPDGLVLQDNALATPGADFTFILRNGLIHDWAVVPWLPEAIAAQPDIYRQLGLTCNPSPTVNQLAGHIENALVTDTQTLNGQSIDPVIIGTVGGSSTPGLADLTSIPVRKILTTSSRHTALWLRKRLTSRSFS